MTTPLSIRRHADVDHRVVLTGLAQDGVTAVPTADDVGHNLQGGDRLHIYSELEATVTGLAVQLWYFSSIADQWFEGPLVQLSAINNKRVVIDSHGEERLFVQTAAANGTGEYKLWAGYSFFGRRP